MGFKKHELERYSIEPYDLVVCEGGEAGRCAVYTGVSGQFMYQKALHRVRPIGYLVIPYFIQFCIQHYVNSGTVIPKPSETTIQHLPLEKMQILPIPLPPLLEQQRIIAEVERRLSVIDELEAVIATNLKRADRLRQAILKRAFEGKLVPQDLTDGPANVLLERICMERERPTEKPKATPQQINPPQLTVQPKATAPVQGELALGFRT
jgi:type I restriction enzyme S subunit